MSAMSHTSYISLREHILLGDGDLELAGLTSAVAAVSACFLNYGNYGFFFKYCWNFRTISFSTPSLHFIKYDISGNHQPLFLDSTACIIWIHHYTQWMNIFLGSHQTSLSAMTECEHVQYTQILWKSLLLVFFQGLNGILFTTIFVGDLLRMLTVLWTASAQSLLGSLFAFNGVLAISTIVLFIHSTTPFCWGVQRTVSSLLIPCSWQ